MILYRSFGRDRSCPSHIGLILGSDLSYIRRVIGLDSVFFATTVLDPIIAIGIANIADRVVFKKILRFIGFPFQIVLLYLPYILQGEDWMLS